MEFAKLKEQGADWLTATSQSQQSAELMLDVWETIKRNEGISRKDVKKDEWFGYVGERAEHMFYGERNDQALILLSSWPARMYANDVLQVGGRPSRFDLQATFEVEKVGDNILSLYEQARHYHPPIGRPLSVAVIRGRQGDYETLYVGRRSSEIFLRVYDKERESKNAYYRSCVRIEAEFKSHTARRVCGDLIAKGWGAQEQLGLLKGYMLRGGMHFDGFERYDASQPLVLRKTSTTESKMAWLLQQVSPTVQALIEEVGLAKVSSVLFLDGLDKHTASDRMD